MEANSAIFAGQFEVELDGRISVAAIAKEYGAAYHRHSSDFEYAQVMLKNIRSTSLEDIRIGLRTARTKNLVCERIVQDTRFFGIRSRSSLTAYCETFRVYFQGVRTFRRLEG